jgi:dipeptidyl-peptidase-4
MKMRCLLLVVLICGLFTPPAGAVSPRLDDLLFPSPLRQPTASHLEPIAGIAGWYDDNHYVVVRGSQLFKVNVLTARESPLPAKEAALWPIPDDGGPSAWPQKGKPGPDEFPSPDKKWIASVKAGNLYVTEAASGRKVQLTVDGNSVITNGKADWVYFEEIFHRSWRTNWWSPDSAHIAFLRCDDTKVPKFTLIDHTQRTQDLEETRYPKSGAANPTVKLGIADAEGGTVAWVDLGDYPDDILISRVGWLPDGKAAYFYVQNRIQTWLDVCTVGSAGGKPARLFRDSTKAWIEDLGELRFLKDGSFLVFSESSGYKHLYHRAADGKLKKQITTGNWDVRKLDKIDEAEGWVYFSGTRDGWLGTQAYRVKLDGGPIEKLTADPGTHEVQFSPGDHWFTDTFSTWDTPPEIRLCRADGSLVRVIDRPEQAKEQPKLGKHEFVQIKTADGFMLNATVLLPPDLDKTKKYPVWFKTYAGPHAPTIRNAFAPPAKSEDQTTAAAGYIVFRADPRSASGQGAVSAWTCYKQLGVQETRDIETAIQWLLDNYPAADAKRVGMSGHSYGGYITAYCLTHSKMFAAGIAGAPVTDWCNYDTIYTERYMDTPQNNPKGYEVSSVVKAAKNLHGRLLLIHGMRDDNVHMQNSIELMDEFQKANVDFEVMLYPHARHGIGGQHYQRLMTDFMKRTLQPGM